MKKYWKEMLERLLKVRIIYQKNIKIKKQVQATRFVNSCEYT